MFIELQNLIKIIINKGVTIKIENREKSEWNNYGFPKQHVEILNYYNKADNDLWDGLVFGYKDFNYEYGTKFKTNQLIGIICIENGNHKLLFKIPHKKNFCKKLFKLEINKFIKKYNKWKLKVKFISIK